MCIPFQINLPLGYGGVGDGEGWKEVVDCRNGVEMVPSVVVSITEEGVVGTSCDVDGIGEGTINIY